MAAPAGVSSGSAPEPAVPEPAATEPMAQGSAAPEPSGAAPGENTAANAVPEPSEPAPGEITTEAAVPKPSEPACGEDTATIAVPEPSGPAPGENTTEAAVPKPSEPAPGENTATIAVPEPSEPGRGENTPEVAIPDPSESAYGENTADSGDPELEPPADERTGGGRSLSWLVTAGVIVVLIAVAAATAALAVATHGFRPKTIAIITYRPAAVFGLRPGECVNSSPNGLSVTVLSCTRPHQAEVFATFSLTGSSWPGTAAVQQQASDGCAIRLAGYLNPQLLNAGLAQEYVYPNRDAWQAGVRTVVCEVSAATGPLSGSVRKRG